MADSRRFCRRLLLAALLAVPQDAPDLIVTGRLFTGVEAGAEALAITGERITAVGTRAEVLALRGAETRLIEAGEASVVPGFNDAHCHFTVGYGVPLGVDLRSATSLEETLTLVETYADAHPELELVEGWGWDLADMPGGRFPTASLLDEIVFDRPVLLSSEGPHALWVNSIAMERAGIGPDSQPRRHQIFLRDEDGAPNGVFLGRIFGLFRTPFPALDEIHAGILAGLADAARHGVTSVHESVSPMLLPYLVQLHDEGRLTVRFHIWGSAFGPLEPYEEQAAELGREDWITFGTIKHGVDGMPSVRTAAMLAPYADDGDTTGLLTESAESLYKTLDQANGRGLRLAIHAVGDAGVRLSVDAFARAYPEFQARNRIEHAFVVDPADLRRSAAADVVYSVQPSFLTIDLEKHVFYEERFGKERCANVLPLRSLLDAGCVLAFGTDFSLTPIDPMVGLHGAVLRQTRDGRPAAGWHPEQRITLAEALRAYTYGSAYAEGAEDWKGTLAPGMLADVVVLSTDIFALDPAQLLDVEVATTIVGGRVVYER